MDWRGILQKYTSFGSDDEARDYEAGRAHSRSCGQRLPVDVLQAGLDKIQAEIDADGEALKTSFLQDLSCSRQELNRLSHLHLGYVDERANANRDYTRALDRVKAQYGAGSNRHAILKSALDREQEAFDRLRYELRRPPKEALPAPVYWFIIVFLFCIEVPVNGLAFQLFNEVFPAMAYLLALAFGVVLFMITHFSGLGFRRVQGAERIGDQALRLIPPLAGVLVLAALVLFLAHLREQVLLVEASTPRVGAQALQPAVGRAVTAFWDRVFGLSDVGWQIAAINALLVLLAIVSAFFKCDPDERYEAVNRRLRAARHAFDRFRLDADDAHVALHGESNGRMAVLEVAITDTDRQFREMRERIEILQAEGRAIVAAMQATRARRTAAYRQGFLHGLAEAGYIGRSLDAPAAAPETSGAGAP
jgi:hypothetical protein